MSSKLAIAATRNWWRGFAEPAAARYKFAYVEDTDLAEVLLIAKKVATQGCYMRLETIVRQPLSQQHVEGEWYPFAVVVSNYDPIFIRSILSKAPNGDVMLGTLQQLD